MSHKVHKSFKELNQVNIFFRLNDSFYKKLLIDVLKHENENYMCVALSEGFPCPFNGQKFVKSIKIQA